MQPPHCSYPSTVRWSLWSEPPRTTWAYYGREFLKIGALVPLAAGAGVGAARASWGYSAMVVFFAGFCFVGSIAVGYTSGLGVLTSGGVPDWEWDDEPAPRRRALVGAVGGGVLGAATAACVLLRHFGEEAAGVPRERRRPPSVATGTYTSVSYGGRRRLGRTGALLRAHQRFVNHGSTHGSDTCRRPSSVTTSR